MASLCDLLETRIRAIALDLDGVVYAGDQLLDRAAEAVAHMRGQGIRTYFVTNNSGRTREQIAGKLSRMGVPAVERDVLTSAYAAARFVAKYVPATVFVIGADGLRQEIAATGARIVCDPLEPCDFLVVGFDQQITYGKISDGLVVMSRGAKFIACNRDAQFPSGGGRNLPGCGAMVGAIEAVVQRRANRVVGKPGTLLLRMIARRERLSPEEILVIGDGLESDIAMASRFGSPSVLLGPTQPDRVMESGRRSIRPDYRLGSLAEWLELFELRAGERWRMESAVSLSKNDRQTHRP